MAVTFTFTPEKIPDVEGTSRVEYGTLTFTGTYTGPNGDVVPTTIFRIARLLGVDFLEPVTSIGQLCSYDRVTRKIKFWQTTTGAPVNLVEVVNGGTVAGNIRVRAYGMGT